MIKRLSVVGLSVCAFAGIFSAPASAGVRVTVWDPQDGQVCYDAQVTHQGSTVVSEVGCVGLP